MCCTIRCIQPAMLEAELGDRGGSEEELQLAGMVIDSASRPLDWQHYRDDTADKSAAFGRGQDRRPPAATRG